MITVKMRNPGLIEMIERLKKEADEGLRQEQRIGLAPPLSGSDSTLAFTLMLREANKLCQQLDIDSVNLIGF